MIDEFIDINDTSYLIVVVITIKEGMPLTVFLGLLEIEGGRKNAKSLLQRLLALIIRMGATRSDQILSITTRFGMRSQY